MRTFINTAGLVFIIFVLVTFCMRNTTPVEINYYFGVTYPFALWLVILVPFLSGVLVGSLLDVIKIFKLRSEISRLKKEFKTMNALPPDPDLD